MPGGRHITITELLQHTSGLADYYDDAFQAAVFARPQRRWATGTLLALGYARSPLFPPGTAWSYSNTGYLLLGRVIQHVTGQPLASALRQLIFAPLGLRATSVPDTPELPAPHPRGYVTETPGGGLTDIATLSPTIALRRRGDHLHPGRPAHAGHRRLGRRPAHPGDPAAPAAHRAHPRRPAVRRVRAGPDRP